MQKMLLKFLNFKILKGKVKEKWKVFSKEIRVNDELNDKLNDKLNSIIKIILL